MTQKQAVNINFSQGVDTKTDPYQVALGKFLNLKNSVFTKGGLLQSRNGFGLLTSLPNNNSTYATTFNGDLLAIGTQMNAYSQPSNTWIDQAAINPANLSALSLIKNATNQSQSDSAVASNGFVCVVWTDQTPSSLSTPIYKYAVADSQTGQNIVEPTVISGADATFGAPKVFVLGNYFIVTYISHPSGYNLNYIAITITNPSIVTSPTVVSTSITPSSNGVAYDAATYNNSLYFAWNGASASGIKMTSLTSHLTLTATITPDGSHVADIVSVTADQGDGTIWIMYYDHTGNVGYALAESPQLHSILAATQIIPSPSTHVQNLTGSAQGGKLTFFYEIVNAYSYDSGVPSNFVKANTITEGGTVGTAYTVARSVGLASKSCIINGIIYISTVYVSPYQTSYFFMDLNGNILSRFAYQNGVGYKSLGLPSCTVNGMTVQFSYLLKDLIQAANTNTNVPSGTQVAGIYTQTGINLLTLTLTTQSLISAEIGLNLHLTGGFLWDYDGYTLTENNFFLYPDSVEVAGSGTSGSMAAQKYFYQVCYEWSDNQGNYIRSAPSLPVTVTLTSDTSVTINVPTLRLSLKNPTTNPVKIVIYRWSAAQQVYYQTTSITSPIINTPSVDSITFTDTNSDATILGNNILYTTGGVLENIGPPGFDSVFLFDSRLWGIVSEDKNLLWYSKAVIEATPVEMSDLLTLYVSPTIGAQGSTGNLKCGAAMDDKLVLFKASAINYINGLGPDNTGANNGYSQPIFITSTVGCSNQKSIVFQPQGLMFEFASEAGNQIWLLGRNLVTEYIGAPVEQFTQNATILSAVNIPGTNQVRFTLDTGITLMYDYYYGQWGTFANVPAISSTLYQGIHTYINSFGQVFQETPGKYLDGSNPVLKSFTTSWIQLAGLQGYQRAYFLYLLGTYLSPHFLNVQLAYDYNSAIVQQTVISPSNFTPNYGSGYAYGVQTPYGGSGTLEQWKIGFTRQRCESFQITISEFYDPSFGVQPGAGVSLSGLNAVIGVKKGYRPTKFTQQAGSP